VKGFNTKLNVSGFVKKEDYFIGASSLAEIQDLERYRAEKSGR
jgi:hypothetical protein